MKSFPLTIFVSDRDFLVSIFGFWELWFSFQLLSRGDNSAEYLFCSGADWSSKYHLKI